MDRTEGVLVAGRYRLVRKLGAGGMGAVWLAHDISLDSACALKLIDDDKAQSEEVRVRFEREARAAAQLRGAHVVDVFDHGEWEGTLYIAMEYLEGEDLGARLERVGVLDPATTYRIVAHVARALVRAHASGIVHRDLKPENIFLVQGDEEEIAKVLDFGIAKHDAYSLQDKATRTGSFLGTPFYVSPEQARGKSTDWRSDLWSLGIIVFQCLTGRPPFESEALGELMGLILYEELPKLTVRNPALPPALDAWWEKAAARDREHRFQSAKELADALGHALGQHRQLAVPAISPRRPSLADASGAFSPLNASATTTGTGSYPPVAAGARVTPPNRPVLPSFSDPEWAEDRLETGAPVSRTRHSNAPPAALQGLRYRASRWFSRRGAQRALIAVRKLPKRNLVMAGVGSGVLLGVILTLVLVPEDESDAPMPRPASSVRAEVAAPPVPPPLPPTQPPPSVTPAPQAPADASAEVVTPRTAQSNDASAPKSVSSSPSPEAAERKKRTPPTVRRRPRGPDYGI